MKNGLGVSPRACDSSKCQGLRCGLGAEDQNPEAHDLMTGQQCCYCCGAAAGAEDHRGTSWAAGVLGPGVPADDEFGGTSLKKCHMVQEQTCPGYCHLSHESFPHESGMF